MTPDGHWANADRTVWVPKYSARGRSGRGCAILFSWLGLGCCCHSAPTQEAIAAAEEVYRERKDEDAKTAVRLAAETGVNAEAAAATRPPGVPGCKNYDTNPYHTCSDFCRQAVQAADYKP